MTFNPEGSRNRSGSGGGCCDNKSCRDAEKKMKKEVVEVVQEKKKEEEKPSCEKGCCGSDTDGKSNGNGNAPPVSVEESCCSSSGGCNASAKKVATSAALVQIPTPPAMIQQKLNQQHMDDDADLDSPLCLAVIREDGGDVVLFDASGRPRSFNFKGDDIRKLCFDTHSNSTTTAKGVDLDDLLTPCFDENGNHGLPEESCFCGVDTPHLHAHLRDPRTCEDNDDDHDNDNGSKKKAAKSKMQDNISYLASQTLHPIDIDDDEDHHHPEIPMVNIDVSDSLPKACNEKSSNSHDIHDIDSHQTGLRRRMHKVRHDDHVDYLVHDPTTNELHLEHPSCNDCGQDDVHGKFRSVGKRQLQRGESSTGGNAAVKGIGKQHRSIRIQFFEVAPRIVTILDAFDLTSGRVAAVEHILDSTAAHPDQRRSKSKNKSDDFWGIPPKVVMDAHGSGGGTSVAATALAPHKNQNQKVPTCFLPPDLLHTSRQGDKKTVRSTLACSRICCAAETPVISAIMDKLVGVEKVMINVPLKQVIVDHFPLQISATDITAALNKNHFGASIKRDGGATLPPTAADMAALPTKGRSHFFVQHICCASEIPAINSIVEPIQGVSAVSINVTTKKVYVDHDTTFVSALDICEALNQEGFGAQIRHDFSTAAASARSMFVQSTLTFEHEAGTADPDTKALTVFLRTFDASQLESFVVDVPAKTITVVHNPLGLSAQTIADQLFEPVGMNASVLVDGADTKMWDIPTLDEDASIDGMEGDEPMTYPSPAVTLSGIFWIISMLSFIGGNWDYLKYVGLLSVTFGLPAIAIKAFRTLRRFQFDTNCLMLFASVGALALGEFAEAAAVVFLFAISEWLEVRATSRARRALSAIVHLRPEKANLLHPTTHELIVVPASAVPVGALVSVKTGDKIPCDGVVVEGQSSIDESSLTGESRPIRKGPGDKVSGGTVNSGTTQLMVRTTSTAENSAVSRLIKLVEEAQANRSETEKLVDEFAKIYTPFVVLAAILMCTIPWAFGSEAGKDWTRNGLILIVVACPCALIISTPVSYVAGLAATAQKGILIKGGANLEALGLVKNICFDKTGTLTNGEFALLHMDVFGEGLSREKVFQYLSLMEERASHPVAQAILTGARNEGVTIPKTMKLQKHTIIAGEGVGGVINGLEVHVGNERLFDRLGLLGGLAESDQKRVESWASIGGTVGYMSVEGEGIVCAFCAADGVRPESATVVKSLKKLGIDLTMLTGDNRDAALAVGGQVGLVGDEIQSRLLPSDKLEYVQSLSANHVKRSVLFNLCSPRQMVMMCGDGVNDAPALAAADIGVAMGAGAALAMETADVTLLDSNLEKLEYSIRMGRRVIAKIKQNVAFSLGVKFVVLGFALAGRTSLWAAIASDVGAMILVTLNAMLLLPARQRENDVAMLKGHIEQASKDRPVMSRNISDTESDDDACVVKSKESGCCTSDSCVGAGKAAQSQKEGAKGDLGAHTGIRRHHDHDHSHAHAETGDHDEHAHSHESHDDSHAQPISGCCSHKESTSTQPHEHSHGHAIGDEESNSQPHEHSDGHAEGHDDSSSQQHERSHEYVTGHDDSIAQMTSGCCSHNESTSLQHEHGHGHGEGHDDDVNAQHNAGSCSQREDSSSCQQERP